MFVHDWSFKPILIFVNISRSQPQGGVLERCFIQVGLALLVNIRLGQEQTLEAIMNTQITAVESFITLGAKHCLVKLTPLRNKLERLLLLNTFFLVNYFLAIFIR